MLVEEAILAARGELNSAGCAEAGEESRLMLCALLGLEPSGLRSHYHLPVDDETFAELRKWIRRRGSGEPLQYIIGEWPFFGRPFRVNPDVLIPRPETEELCALAVRMIRERGYARALDLCCGSGCIGITIRLETGISVDAGDIDAGALAIARANALRLDADVRFFRGDLFEAISERTYDIILINPPYLTGEEMRTMQPELSFEPSVALYGGEDGLAFYRRIAASYRNHLQNGGMLLMEIGEKQGDAIGSLFPGCRILRDLCGKDRICAVGEYA